MTWIKQLYENKIIDITDHQGKPTYHLKTPCEVLISDEVISELKEIYLPDQEVGGVLFAKPEKNGRTTILKIERIVQIDNVHPEPESKYRMDPEKWRAALKDSIDNHLFPIRFHTHPTEDENPAFEVMNYLAQSNTSKQDQKVSNSVLLYANAEDEEKTRVIFPEALVLGSISTGRLFIGFYNGLIAPIEFSANRTEIFRRELDKLSKKLSDWTDSNEKKALLIGGGVIVLLLSINSPKTMFPVLILLMAMVPLFLVNDQNGEPEYFAQISQGSVKIKFPEI